ncbi:hypothetical protein CR513_15747, partial [Mucuna pruriens]
MAENEKLKEGILDSRTKEAKLRSQLYLFQEKMNLLEEEVARDRLYKENLEVQRRQDLVELVEERMRAANLEQQAQATIEELKTKVGSWKSQYIEMVNHVEARVQAAQEEAHTCIAYHLNYLTIHNCTLEGKSRLHCNTDEQDVRTPHLRSSSKCGCSGPKNTCLPT